MYEGPERRVGDVDRRKRNQQQKPGGMDEKGAISGANADMLASVRGDEAMKAAMANPATGPDKWNIPGFENHPTVLRERARDEMVERFEEDVRKSFPEITRLVTSMTIEQFTKIWESNTKLQTGVNGLMHSQRRPFYDHSPELIKTFLESSAGKIDTFLQNLFAKDRGKFWIAGMTRAIEHREPNEFQAQAIKAIQQIVEVLEEEDRKMMGLPGGTRGTIRKATDAEL